MKNILLIFSLVIFFASCQKDPAVVLPDNNNPNGNTDNNNTDNDDDDNDDDDNSSVYYFSGEVDGKAVNYGTDYVGIYQAANSSREDEWDIYEGTAVGKTTTADTNAIWVSMLKYFDHEPSLDEHWAMFETGEYEYGLPFESSETISGASILFFDEHGKEWSSERGPQTGSSFNVTEVTENEDHLYGMIFAATFNCKLYDEQGNSIELKNAKVRGPIYGR